MKAWKGYEHGINFGGWLSQCPHTTEHYDTFITAEDFRTVREYTIVTQDRGKAADCIQCGQCESVCPQHLPIISLLEKCREMET